ncbi:hypothetical protein COB57_03125 [Candidatus Peregrinibacteria bacterium]|nr:MAG: hypothetical protein COB57_03125 [Candidatus Peregrinibacteria bacterium]
MYTLKNALYLLIMSMLIFISMMYSSGNVMDHSHTPEMERDMQREGDLFSMRTVISSLQKEYGATPLSGLGDKYPPECLNESSNLYLCLKKMRVFDSEEILIEVLSGPLLGETVPGSEEVFSYKYSANENGFKICSFLEGEKSRLFRYEKLPTEISEKNIEMFCATKMKDESNTDRMSVLKDVGVPIL